MGRNLDNYIKNNYQKAIDFHEIQPFYQPVIRTSSCQLCSFEALARWIDPELGIIYPDEFIPVLERERVIHHLDEAILRRVCARIRRSLTNGETPIPVSVNLSRLDFFLCDDIFSLVDNIVSDYEIPHDLIYFEITESVMAKQKELLQRIVEQFHAAGYQIWMDDFGSAYSSLNVLKEIAFDELKLDMGFLRPFTQRSMRIATSVVEMAKKLDIHTLAEGVETEEHYSFLRDIGCEKVQGYYFGKPLPYDEALENLRGKGIQIEAMQDRQYYDEIGRIDFLSAVPFMTREAQDKISTARELNSIPLSLAEFSAKYFKILFYNSAFENTAYGTGMFANVLSQEILRQPQPYHRLSEKIRQLMEFVRTNGEGRMLMTFKEQYYEVMARCVAKTHDRYCVLLRITNLTKASQSDQTRYLDEFVRRIYALFERITLINNKEDSIRPIYMTATEDMVSGRKGISKLLKEYSEKYIFPEDQERFFQTFEPNAMYKRIKENMLESFSDVFRAKMSHGNYSWKEYTILRIDDVNCFLLVRSLNDGIRDFIHSYLEADSDGGVYSPAHLWNSLTGSDILRIFWKDEDRRFLGASKAFLDYYGFTSAREIIGKNDEDLGWHVHPDLYMNDEYKVIHEGITLHNVPGLCMNEGENREIMASKMPFYDVNGEIRGLIGYFIDRKILIEQDEGRLMSSNRDPLTGLLNTRGISEEAVVFREEYHLRHTDFVRAHISVNDFGNLNERYGFNFGDKLLRVLGEALKSKFGRSSAIGRYSGNHFVVLHQIQDDEQVLNLRSRIKDIGASIRSVEGTPVTLYLSVGFVLYSETEDLDEQARLSEVRLHADHDQNISAESRLTHSTEIFHLFDNLPISYSVYHVTWAEHSGLYDAVIFYVNRKFEEYGGLKGKDILGHSVREVFPHVGEEWFDLAKRAALDHENIEDVFIDQKTGKTYQITVTQILYNGYCAFTYQEIASII